jgi:hypothetical protein
MPSPGTLAACESGPRIRKRERKSRAIPLDRDGRRRHVELLGMHNAERQVRWPMSGAVDRKMRQRLPTRSPWIHTVPPRPKPRPVSFLNRSAANPGATRGSTHVLPTHRGLGSEIDAALLGPARQDAQDVAQVTQLSMKLLSCLLRDG